MKLKILYIVCPTFLLLFLFACGTTRPLIPAYSYDRFKHSEKYSNHDIFQIDNGYYVLKVYKYDTIFARSSYKYYTVNKKLNETNSKATDSMYLYFIDDYRFYYTKHKLNTIDIEKDFSNTVRIGIYNVERQSIDNSEEKSVYMVHLITCNANEKDSLKYDYANIYLALEDSNKSLKFVEVDYPLSFNGIEKTDNTKKHNPIPSFSPNVLRAITDKKVNTIRRNYEANEMEFRPEWKFVNDTTIKLKASTVQFDNVVYSISNSMVKRVYKFNLAPVYKDSIVTNSNEKTIKSKSW